MILLDQIAKSLYQVIHLIFLSCKVYFIIKTKRFFVNVRGYNLINK